MGSFSEGEEYQFFDAQEDIVSISNAKSDVPDMSDSNSSCSYWNPDSFPSESWIQSPSSVKERRSKFIKWIGLSLDRIAHENSVDVCDHAPEGEIDRFADNDETCSITSGFEVEFSSSRSSMSSWSNDTLNSSEEFHLMENFVCRKGNLDGGMQCNVDQMGQDGKVSDGKEVDSDQSVLIAEEFETTSLSSPSFQRLMDKEIDEINDYLGIMKRARRRWLRTLRSITCMIDRQGEADKLTSDDNCAVLGSRIQRVKVRQSKKQTKELSALYMGQDIQAHEGSILTMKFSPDGKYLASAGEDGVLRLWQVVEDERRNEIDIPEVDPSSIYFTVNNLSELTPLFVDKEKMSKLKSLRKTSDSACIIFPPKVFRLLEKPVHEFHGHSGEILDLSWSKNNYLLSSSTDKTVRLWRVGYEQCLKVFSHNNYVTCVQFNPVNDNYFISGSIDGKVRIWAIPECQVVDWTDIREIVTAVCYRPDGQGGIVGSMTGNCRLFNVSENHLHLDAQLCLHSKKKSPCKRITGFQFLPQDSSIVMVTCANSQVRILQGLVVIGKYRGVRNVGSQLSASFTSDGKHIVSACEDCNVYLWNFKSQGEATISQAKKIRSFERFASNASVAIPWSGLKCRNSESECQFDVMDETSAQILPLNSPACFYLGQEFLLESFPKGSATWPEEKLPSSSPRSNTSAMHKSQYKFLKSSCQSTCSSRGWGLVIVTAGWDGRHKVIPQLWVASTCMKFSGVIHVYKRIRTNYFAWTCPICSVLGKFTSCKSVL
ncbi:WD repeat-containing protein 44 [Quillaja saponaria]|uniref:WD repeat-containing protein 44 n=1 Tax=Quillaja saponaria TaxID=32244 RepID=A0AAD7LXQ9_QUISA|nr:WD repeat-containing protein 44 [Quillaja saponaria]